MGEKKLLVTVDLYGEGEFPDMFEGYIYNKTYDEFVELKNEFEHDGSNDIRATWAEFLEENGVKYEHLNFDIDEA